MSNNNNRSNQVTNQLDDIEPRWFAVYVKVKTEKYVAQQLSRKGIEAYVPLLEETKQYTSKVRRIQRPLINSYVFVKIVQSEYVTVLQTLHVVNFLRIGSDLLSIPEKEIETLMWVVGERSVLSAENKKLSLGKRVEVIGGNLTGLRGVIVEKKNKKFFMVQLDTMGFVLGIDIAEELLTPLLEKEKASL